MAPLACSDIHFNGLNLFEIYFFLHHYNIFSVSCKLWGQLDRKETRAHSRALFWRSYARCQKILLGILLALSLSLTLPLALHHCVFIMPLTLIFVFAFRWPWVHTKMLDVRWRVARTVQTPRLRWSLFFLGLILSPDPGSWVQLDLGGKPGWKYAISSKLTLRSCFSTHNTTKMTMTLQSSDWSSKGRSNKNVF